MKQLHVILDHNQQSVPVTMLQWNDYGGELEKVKATTEYNPDNDFMDFWFNVAEIKDGTIYLTGCYSPNFTAKIYIK